MIVKSMRGLGDNIYQRAFVKGLPKPVYIDTPWPELYEDIPGVHFTKPETKLRTQAKNIKRQVRRWDSAPSHSQTRIIRYGAEGIVPGMTSAFRARPVGFDLPAPRHDVGWLGHYVVVRPVTLRTEWMADTRNPEPEYVAQASAEAVRRGYTVVSVADLEHGKEFIVGTPPEAHHSYHAGELDVLQLMALIQGAAAVIGGIGWIVPAALAAECPAWIVCGGQGGFNAPELICPPGSTITFSVPDNFCRCKHRQHNCNKRIANHDADFTRWANQHLPVV